MKLPFLDTIRTAQSVIANFGGLNHTPGAKDTEFFDMRNMTSDGYPLLMPRRPYALLQSLTAPQGLYAHDKLCWAADNRFYYDGLFKGSLTAGNKQFVSMGSYIIIWPDKKIYKTQTGEFRNLEHTETTAIDNPHWPAHGQDDVMQFQSYKGVFNENDCVTIQYKVYHPGTQEPDDWWLEDKEKNFVITHIYRDTSDEQGMDIVDIPYDDELDRKSTRLNSSHRT